VEGGVNQRAIFRWIAAPRGELIVPDTANAGIAFVAFHATDTGDVDVTAHFEE